MLSEVQEYLGALPYMTVRQAKRLTKFLTEHQLSDCLELGFFHGVSSAYISDNLRLRGVGHLTTIDLEPARAREPNIEKIVDDLGLSDWVTVYYEPRSFTWRLMKMIEEDNSPRFDFCYIDGGHTWDVSGFGFFLVEKLLRPGGWLLFDDLDWHVAPRAEARIQSGNTLPSWMARMTNEERQTRQVRKVWEILVKQHGNFDEFFEEGQWGFAHKKGELTAITDKKRARSKRKRISSTATKNTAEKIKATGKSAKKDTKGGTRSPK